MRIVMVLIMIAFAGGVAQAQIYKWVDENGKVHYSDKPPNDATTEKISKPREPAAADSTPRSSNSMRSSAKPLEGEAKELADALVQGLMKGEADAKQINCSSAVESARSSIDSMLSAARANVKSGHMSQSDFEKARPELERMRNKISVGECNSSSGKQRDFYLCMSNPNNHIAACGQRYDYK